MEKIGGDGFRAWLDTVAKWDGNPLGAGLKDRVGLEHARWMVISDQIRAGHGKQQRAVREDAGHEPEFLCHAFRILVRGVPEYADREIERRGFGRGGSRVVIHRM